MIWDFVIAYFLFTMAIAGWNLGLSNSWRVLFSVLAATVMTQHLYMNIAAWLDDQTRMTVDSALFIGYAVTWVLLMAVSEFALLEFMPIKGHRQLQKWDAAGGALVGIAKALAVLLFACLASSDVVNWQAPPRMPIVAIWMSHSSNESQILSYLQETALRLPNSVVRNVIAVNGPSFQPTFADPKPSAVEIDRTRRIRQLFQAIDELQRDAGI